MTFCQFSNSTSCYYPNVCSEQSCVSSAAGAERICPSDQRVSQSKGHSTPGGLIHSAASGCISDTVNSLHTRVFVL